MMKILNYLFIFTITFSSKFCAAKECPVGCSCYSDRSLIKIENVNFNKNETFYKLECSKGHFAYIPNGFLPNTTTAIDLSLNNIEMIERIDILPYLTSLSLSGNEISDITANAFINISKELRFLDLSRNQLNDNLNERVFRNFFNLRILNLSHNGMKHLPETLFDDLTSLTELDLSANRLKHVSPRLFRYTSKLEKLNLYNIASYALDNDQFHSLPKLVSLDISYNDYKRVPADGLRSAANLKYLKLDGNLFKALDEDSFRGLSTLEELSLCDIRPLTDIKEETFSSLYNLTKLVINNNPALSFINRNAFYNMFNDTHLRLREIELKNNRLTNVDEDMLPWCSLAHVDLRDNQWICDCYFKFFKACKHAERIVNGLRCGSPPHLRGMDVALIEPEMMECYRNTEKEMKLFRLMVIVLGIVMLIFLAILIVILIKRNSIVRWCRDNKRAGAGSIYYVKAQTTPSD